MKCHEDFCFVMAVMIVVSSAPSPLTTALLLHLIESEPCDSSDTPPSVSCPPGSWSLITLLCVREHHWRNVNVAPDVLALLLIVAAAPEGLSHGDQGSSPLSSQPCPLGPTMISTESVLESGDQPCIALEPLKNTHLPGKATPAGGGCAALADGNPKVTANGVHDIEDRILRITGYYGYNPGYSSHRSEWKEKKKQQSMLMGSWGGMRQCHGCLCQVWDRVSQREQNFILVEKCVMSVFFYYYYFNHRECKRRWCSVSGAWRKETTHASSVLAN